MCQLASGVAQALDIFDADLRLTNVIASKASEHITVGDLLNLGQ